MTESSGERGHAPESRDPDLSPATQQRDLPPAARRALAEAEQRRKAVDADAAPPREIGGRGGKDPARYGDWEIKGRAIDF